VPDDGDTFAPGGAGGGGEGGRVEVDEVGLELAKIAAGVDDGRPEAGNLNRKSAMPCAT
jgi:hypothetical protein